MAWTRSMTRNQNHDGEKRIRTCGTWSDLSHDVLNIIMMELGVIDYVAFSRVCKSWRSLALCNKNKFIVSRQPMSISISTTTDANEKECHLVDYEGRRLKINVPHSAGRTCFGVTCGYLILCDKITRDFWLVNPITRHELHFPFPFPQVSFYFFHLGAILVFSHSISGWVFVVFKKHVDKIWLCIVGKREWTCVYTSFPINHLRDFKGKIYTLYENNRVGEVTLCPTPKVTLLEIKNIPEPRFRNPRFLSWGENLFVMDQTLVNYQKKKICEINLSKMEWVSLGNAGDKYGLFFSSVENGAAAIRVELWADHQSKYRRHAVHFTSFLPPDESGESRFWYANMWYCFHDCLLMSYES